MTTNVQISCINKTPRNDPNDSIDRVGGIHEGKRWSLPLQNAIEGAESGKWRFFTSVRGKSVWVIVATSRAGNKYLRTEPDDNSVNNLLSLPECP